jgi:hypothetical protein
MDNGQWIMVNGQLIMDNVRRRVSKVTNPGLENPEGIPSGGVPPKLSQPGVETPTNRARSIVKNHPSAA